ncbi:MAG: hypothetical protein L0H55_14485 [Candidatus Nitrosocosmicus sp.]|nr:hypothetical protein [Candidatus Nitrosocosmicus sp.]
MAKLNITLLKNAGDRIKTTCYQTTTLVSHRLNKQSLTIPISTSMLNSLQL